MRPFGSFRRWRSVKDQSKFEAYLDPGFASEIATIPGGEKLQQCIQCGTCTAVCPMSAYMDYTPRRMIAMTRAGCRDDVLGSLAIWVCTSCYSCTVECPKRIPITEIMHGLRQMAVEEDRYPRRFTTPVMAQAFVEMIERRGRSTESWISVKLYLRTNPWLLVKNAAIALRLIRRGRLGFGRESVRDPGELKAFLAATERPAAVRSSVERVRQPTEAVA
ncbi:MAG TPA: 4Fe-4S dicluster domain-containing protein [Actinomycetota bacterium]